MESRAEPRWGLCVQSKKNREAKLSDQTIYSTRTSKYGHAVPARIHSCELSRLSDLYRALILLVRGDLFNCAATEYQQLVGGDRKMRAYNKGERSGGLAMACHFRSVQVIWRRDHIYSVACDTFFQ